MTTEVASDSEITGDSSFSEPLYFHILFTFFCNKHALFCNVKEKESKILRKL